MQIECAEQRKYARQWWTSMWGFIVTLIALTMDVWGVGKATEMFKDTIRRLTSLFFMAVLHPLAILWIMLKCTTDGMAMLANLREAIGNDVLAPLYPWTKSHIKIILGCRVIVNLSPDVHEAAHNLDAFQVITPMEDLSEALVIGLKVADSKQFNVQLARLGQLALLRSNVLPPYDELKFLRGHSSWGMAIASAQAIGYIFGIVVRCMQGLQVSPMEAIVCVLNMVILMKGVLHNFASLGHRPLLLYLLPEEEAKFIEECKNVQDFDFKVSSRYMLGVLIACGVLLSVGAYFIVNFLKSCKRCIVPVILFEVSLVLGGIHGLTKHSKYQSKLCNSCLLFPLLWLNIIGYVWALAISFRYWKGEEFDVQSSNYLSQVLPYTG